MSKTLGSAKGPIPIGEFGERVARNVAALKGTSWRTLQELSDRLAAAGRPIPPLGIGRMFRGERRLDVDDLVALARVLDVQVADLLFRDVSARVVVTICETADG